MMHLRASTTMLNPDELDVFECSLDGVNQIEASAGTGKTWNICALYVRLLLEKKLAADAILVVTFTKAATAELHERIRSRLVEIAHAMETGETGGDAFLERLFDTTLAHIDHDEALKRIHIALHTFDQAAIHTIHAFCQRALQEAPFAAAMPFAFDLEADDSALRFEMAADFCSSRGALKSRWPCCAGAQSTWANARTRAACSTRRLRSGPRNAKLFCACCGTRRTGSARPRTRRL
jgi:exodeoxyribonuclease V beta subunit